MTVPELTRQQLDPAGTLGMRLLTRLLCAAAFGYAAVMMLRSVGDIRWPVFAVAGVAMLGIACLTVLWASDSRRAPFTRQRHLLVVLIVLLAIALSAVGEWGANRFVRDDWWSVSFGLMFIAVSHYRPARELVVFGTLAGVFVAIVVWLQSDGLVTDAPAYTFILVAVTPMLGMCYAAAAYGNTLVTALQQWRAGLGYTSASVVDRFRQGISRSVQQERVTILSRDVLPFFTSVIAEDRVGDTDRERARAIAASLRGLMVAQADRSWLENVIATAARDRVGEHDEAIDYVSDRSGLAAKMTADQRTILRAVIVAVFDDPMFDGDSLRLRLERDALMPVAWCQLRVDFRAPRRAVRSVMAPFAAVMRITFDQMHLDLDRSSATLKFSYGID